MVVDCHKLVWIPGNAGVTENKYSPNISTPPVHISREIGTPLGIKVLPGRALRKGIIFVFGDYRITYIRYFVPNFMSKKR